MEKRSALHRLDEGLRLKYESIWLYSESHPWRLAQHIVARGLLAGSVLGFVSGLAYALVRTRGQVLRTVGRITFRGTAIGGVLMGVAAAERVARLPTEGTTDRAYRISYNWDQTKWDYLGLPGGLLGAVMLRSPFGGLLPGASVGLALGSFAYIGSAILLKSSSETKKEAMKEKA